MDDKNNEIMKVSDAAKYLKISKSLLYQLIEKKEITHIRLTERRIVIRKLDIDNWIEKSKVEAYR